MTHTIKCQHCQQEKPLDEFVNGLWEAEICEPCADAYAEEMITHYRPRYEGEKNAGWLRNGDDRP